MDLRLEAIGDIDHNIDTLLQENEINSEKISQLVDKRDQILQELLCSVEENSSLFKTEEWYETIQNTKRLVGLMQSKTASLGEQLKRYRHGNKSVQQYKKYL
ncbi:flagellar protein FliT [Vibrio salinus]|uniref:flagellar protein FliT n=1 Tax=Vibrio salinus TaxID=2899784 RepID=UPI001E3073B2|nr:flagellar protein FliT [Vibrio salinus]MCE0494516.1 flagellar protein FliT [Vibrio salinus]